MMHSDSLVYSNIRNVIFHVKKMPPFYSCIPMIFLSLYSKNVILNIELIKMHNEGRNDYMAALTVPSDEVLERKEQILSD